LICLIFQYLWTLSEYRKQFLEISTDSRRFVKFTNCVANDLIYLLDESLKYLSEIRELQLLLDDEIRWNSLSQNERNEKSALLKENEKRCKSLLALANATVHLLYYMSCETISPFVTTEFVERMATMMDYYILKLNGPTVTELKVKNKEQLGFHPRKLLQEIMSIFLNLSGSEAFLKCVADDERSYDEVVFDKTIRTLRNKQIMSPYQINRLEKAIVKIKQLHSTRIDLDAALGDDFPEEFTDALLGTLMNSPVQLPTSKQVVDRVTIKRHLLNSQTGQSTK